MKLNAQDLKEIGRVLIKPLVRLPPKAGVRLDVAHVGLCQVQKRKRAEGQLQV